MALRNLVEGECGAPNPLVQWTSHFAQEKSMLKVGLDHDRLSDIKQQGSINEAQLVDEFLGSAHHRPAIPQTYNMATLLDELQMTQQAPPPPTVTLDPSTHSDTRVQEWVKEFAPPAAVRTGGTVPANDWAREFQQGPDAATAETDQWVKEFTPTEEKWVQEFQDQYTPQQSSLSAVAKELKKTVTDPEIKATEFMDFVNKLSTGEVEFDDQHEMVINGENWAGQFAEEEESKTKSGEGFWGRLEKEWEDMSQQDQHPWLTDFESQQPTREYKFEENNPLKDVSQPLEEGLKKLAEGDLPSAVLLFEAEVQAHPESVEGWRLLGSTQADNEQDQAAIPALHKCLELDAGNLAAQMSLAVCYTNESQQSKVQQIPVWRAPAIQADLRRHIPAFPASKGKALESLREWIKQNPKYSRLVPSTASTRTPPFTHSFMTQESHAEVRDLYIAAAQSSPEQVDLDVQVGLGVLFNLSNEYDKAVDCFTAAIQVKPEDAMLWNKLGATLANSNKSEEAVEAYRKALQILPGFTRSRYNLGVSCVNLGAYKEGVEHFLTALHLQKKANTSSITLKPSQMSDGIWSTLRLAISLMGKPELQPAVHNKDLDTLLKHFGMEY